MAFQLEVNRGPWPGNLAICNVQKAQGAHFARGLHLSACLLRNDEWKRELAAYSLGQLADISTSVAMFYVFLSFFQGGSTPTLQNPGGFLAGKASETTRSSWVQRLCSCFLVVEQLWKVAETAGTAADQKKHQLQFGWHLHAFTCICYMKPGYDRYDGIWKQWNRTSRCRQQNMRISSRSQGAMNFESTSCEWVRRVLEKGHVREWDAWTIGLPVSQSKI